MDQATRERRSEITLTNIYDKDCGVVAVQAVTGWRRQRAEAALRKMQPQFDPLYHGTTRGSIERTLEKAGYRCSSVPPGYKDTPATFTMRHEVGMYLIYVHEHVMALVDGDLHNSRGDWHSAVEQVTAVSRG